MEQKKGKALATSYQVTSKGNVEIEMFLQTQKYKSIKCNTKSDWKVWKYFWVSPKEWGLLKTYLPLCWSPLCLSVFSIIIIFVSVRPQDGAKHDLCTVFLSCLHESPRLRMHFHYSAAKCIQVLSEREQWQTWRLYIQHQRFLRWLV